MARDAVPNGHRYSVKGYEDAGGNTIGEYWTVEGMGHAYSGGHCLQVPVIDLSAPPPTNVQ